MQDPCQHSHTQIGHLIRNETWNIFRDRYRSKFKHQLPAQTFTVLASLTLINTQNGIRKIVSVGFGTKSLPKSLLQDNRAEDLLVDMHAEILALRGFWRFLLKQADRESIEYLGRDEKRKKFKLSDKYRVYLYCSQIFCGDCCINTKQQSFSGAKPLKYFTADKYPELKYEPNILRTKPGRMDLPVNRRSPVLSCSDLIALYNLGGIQGPQLFSSFLPIYLHTIIVDSHQSMRQNIASGIDFIKRLSVLKNRKEELLERQIFNIVIDNKQKKISKQFKRNIPRLIVLQKPSNSSSRNHQGFELCGIITETQQEWINGKSGLPEGSSLKTFKVKGKTSSFCNSKLAADFPTFRTGDDSFKYTAIQQRLNVLFGEWLCDI